MEQREGASKGRVTRPSMQPFVCAGTRRTILNTNGTCVQGGLDTGLPNVKRIVRILRILRVCN